MKAYIVFHGLTENQRRRCEMKMSGMSGWEVAKAEGVSPATIYNTLRRCLPIVKRNLKMKPSDTCHPHFKYSLITDERLRRDKMQLDGQVYTDSFPQINETRPPKPGKYYYNIKSASCRRFRMKKEGLSVRDIATLEKVSTNAVYLSIKTEENPIFP